jgi:hypothetical protein
VSKRAWLTYAWDDNESGDVEFVAQQLDHRGIVSASTAGT